MHRPSYVPITANFPFMQKFAAVIKLLPEVEYTKKT